MNDLKRPLITEHLVKGCKGLRVEPDGTAGKMYLSSDDVKEWFVSKDGNSRQGYLDPEYTLSCQVGYVICIIDGVKDQIIMSKDGPQSVKVPFKQMKNKDGEFDEGWIGVRVAETAFDVVTSN
jgi:hypothetical protein